MRALVLPLCILLTLSSLFVGCGDPKQVLVSQPLDPRYVERGFQLVEGLAACGYCHGSEPRALAPLSGGRAWNDEYGVVRASNLTPVEGALAGWSTRDILRVLRESVRKDGEDIASDVHRGYEWMSDEDLLAVVSYIRALAPAGEAVERRDVSFIDRNTTGFFSSPMRVRGYVPAIQPRFEREYGKYLVDSVARCDFCHQGQGGVLESSGYLEGGKTIKTDLGEWVAPPLTASVVDGLGSWTEDDIVRFLKSGALPRGGVIDAQSCPTEWFRNAAESELRAMARYLKSLPAS